MRDICQGYRDLARCVLDRLHKESDDFVFRHTRNIPADIDRTLTSLLREQHGHAAPFERDRAQAWLREAALEQEWKPPQDSSESA